MVGVNIGAIRSWRVPRVVGHDGYVCRTVLVRGEPVSFAAVKVDPKDRVQAGWLTPYEPSFLYVPSRPKLVAFMPGTWGEFFSDEKVKQGVLAEETSILDLLLEQKIPRNLPPALPPGTQITFNMKRQLSEIVLGKESLLVSGEKYPAGTTLTLQSGEAWRVESPADPG